MPNQRPNPRPYRMEYTKKINRLKMENDKPKKQVKVLKKELTELREKLKKRQINDWSASLNGLA